MSQKSVRSGSAQKNNYVIAIALRHRVSNQSGNSLSLSNEEVHDVTEQRPQIINNVAESSDVHINNTNNNFYNAPVVIHHCYPQCEKINDVSENESNFSHAPCGLKFCFHRAVLKFCPKKRNIAIFLLVLMVLILIILLIVWSFTTKKAFRAPNEEDSSQNQSEIYRMRIVTKDEWKAEPPRGPTDPLKSLPPACVIISHTETVLCYTQDQCTMIVQRIQIDHMNLWYDIAYNFLVGGDGLVYEGRGWDVEGAHTLRYNRVSIGISLIGTFKTEPPTKEQLQATQTLIDYGVEHGHIAPDYKLFGHRQLHDSDSPGRALFNIIKSWKHWTSKLP